MHIYVNKMFIMYERTTFQRLQSKKWTWLKNVKDKNKRCLLWDLLSDCSNTQYAKQNVWTVKYEHKIWTQKVHNTRDREDPQLSSSVR